MAKEVSGSYSVKDAPELVAELEQSGSIHFAFTVDGVQAFIITLVKDFKKLGILPFGGKVEGLTIVAVQGFGVHPMDLNGHGDINPNYVAEKLGMKLESDNATQIAQLLNAMRSANRTPKKKVKEA